MNPSTKYRNKDLNHFSEFYDKYSGAVYSLILRIVDNKIIAEKLLLKVFADAFVHNNIHSPKLVSEFIAMTNHARKKALGTRQAITIFRACNEGRTCVTVSKQA